MKRDFLKDLGLADEAIDKIMAENGKDIEAVKASLSAKEAELATAQKTISDLKETLKKFDGVDVEKLKADLAAAQEKYNNDISKIKLDNALELALRDAKARNPKAVKALLNHDEIKLDGDKLLGLDAQLEAIKKDNDFLFEAEKQEDTQDTSTVTLNSGGAHSAKGGVDYDKMSDEEYYAQVFKKDK